MSHPWLTIPTPVGTSSQKNLDKDEILIGRQNQLDIVLAYTQVSRRHARIFVEGRRYWIEDLGSHNGTFVNGTALGTEPHQLTDGDQLVIGGAVALTFNDPGQTVAGPRIGRLRGIWMDDSTDVWIDSVQITPPLSLSQLKLLRLLYERADQEVSRDEIIAAVWPNENPAGISKQAIDGLIKRLRHRLRQASPDQDYITVVRGFGLRLKQAKD